MLIVLILMLTLFALISEWIGYRIDNLWITKRIWRKNIKLERKLRITEKWLNRQRRLNKNLIRRNTELVEARYQDSKVIVDLAHDVGDL